MKNRRAFILARLVLFSASLALAKTVEPAGTEMEHFAGKTLHAAVGAYDPATGTFPVTVYDYDRYDRGDANNLATGDILLAGGFLYRIIGRQDVLDDTVFLCEDGEEIYFGQSYDGSDDLIARSTTDDRIFMNAVTILHLPPAEGIIYEDNSDPDLDAEAVVTEGLEDILSVQAE